MRHVRMVPCDHHHAAHPGLPKPCDRTPAVGAERVLEHHGTDQNPVDANEHVGEALDGSASAHARSPGRHGATVGHIGGAADHHAASGHASAHAAARVLVNLVGKGEAEAAGASCLDDRPSKSVCRNLIQRSAESQHLVRAEAPVGFDVGNSRSTFGQRARLVEEEDIRTPERFERRAALDDDAPPRSSRHAPNERNRRGEDEGARRGHHQDSNSPDGVAGEDSRQSSHRHGQGYEPQGKPVGNAYKGCARLLSLANQPHDAGVRALIGGGGTAETKGATAIDATAPHGIAHHPFHERGFAGERGFIEYRRITCQQAVDRNHLTGSNDEHIARSNGVDRLSDELVTFDAVHHGRRSREQCGQLSSSPC